MRYLIICHVDARDKDSPLKIVPDKRLISLGYTLESDELQQAFDRFKRVCDVKKDVYDEDLAAIVENEVLNTTELYELVDIKIDYRYSSKDSKKTPEAKITIKNLENNKNNLKL